MGNTDAGAQERAGFVFSTTRDFAVPPARMFEIWTEARHLSHWFGPKGFDITGCTNDLRPGGLMHYGLRAPGGLEFWGRWVHREIDPPRRLEFVASFSDAAGGVVRNPWSEEWPLQMLSVVEFAPSAGGTTVTVSATAYEATEAEAQCFADGADSMRQGWAGTFDNLAAYLAELTA